MVKADMTVTLAVAITNVSHLQLAWEKCKRIGNFKQTSSLQHN